MNQKVEKRVKLSILFPKREAESRRFGVIGRRKRKEKEGKREKRKKSNGTSFK